MSVQRDEVSQHIRKSNNDVIVFRSTRSIVMQQVLDSCKVCSVLFLEAFKDNCAKRFTIPMNLILRARPKYDSHEESGISWM